MNNRKKRERRFWDRFANYYDFFIDKAFRKTYKAILGGFKVVNKWSFLDFQRMLTNNGLVINKALRIEGKLLTAYIVMKK